MILPARLDPEEFLKQGRSHPVIDVRSPLEYMRGHIPGAYSVPLFNDEERALVGITYTKSGTRAAILEGLRLAGPTLPDIVLQAEKISRGGALLVHCWRGGMRSEAMAWVLNFSGISTFILEGGYRAYRRHIREALGKGPPVIILGGMTGSGKTEILQMLATTGDQVIDLEMLAHHKGSAFGELGQVGQPTTEQFENDLAQEWISMSANEPVWVEDESLNIGKVIIPEPFFHKMLQAPVVYLDVPFEIRVERLVREYGGFDITRLEEVIHKISRRMGGDQANDAVGALKTNDLHRAVSLVLAYYDKTYSYSYEKKKEQTIRVIQINDEREITAVPSLLKTIR